MRTPFDDIEFLARSDHRITVLETLTEEGLTPNELREATGISRATIGRVLGNFEDRGWVKRSGGRTCVPPSATSWPRSSPACSTRSGRSSGCR